MPGVKQPMARRGRRKKTAANNAPARSLEAKYGKIGANQADPIGLRMLSGAREMISAHQNKGGKLDVDKLWNLLYDADVAIRRLLGQHGKTR